jgi:hypothetical protein
MYVDLCNAVQKDLVENKELKRQLAEAKKNVPVCITNDGDGYPSCKGKPNTCQECLEAIVKNVKKAAEKHPSGGWTKEDVKKTADFIYNLALTWDAIYPEKQARVLLSQLYPPQAQPCQSEWLTTDELLGFLHTQGIADDGNWRNGLQEIHDTSRLQGTQEADEQKGFFNKIWEEYKRRIVHQPRPATGEKRRVIEMGIEDDEIEEDEPHVTSITEAKLIQFKKDVNLAFKIKRKQEAAIRAEKGEEK